MWKTGLGIVRISNWSCSLNKFGRLEGLKARPTLLSGFLLRVSIECYPMSSSSLRITISRIRYLVNDRITQWDVNEDSLRLVTAAKCCIGRYTASLCYRLFHKDSLWLTWNIVLCTMSYIKLLYSATLQRCAKTSNIRNCIGWIP